MALATITKAGHRLIFIPMYKVTLTDRTGKMSFTVPTRARAERLADQLTALVGSRPVGPIANLIASDLGFTPKTGQEWTFDA